MKIIISIKTIVILTLFLLLSFSVWSKNESLSWYNQQLLDSLSSKFDKQHFDKTLHLIAARREIFMKALNQGDIAEVKNHLFTYSAIQSFPKALQPFLEKEVAQIEGVLEIRSAIHHKLPEYIEYVLQSKGKTYYLHLEGRTENLKPGATYQIAQATLLGFSKQYGLHLIVAPNDIMLIQDTQFIAATRGPQKTIFFLVNFQDKPNDRPWSLDSVKYALFKKVNAFVNEYSFGKASVVGDGFGWFVIPLTSTASCSTLSTQVATLAEEEAKKAGVDSSTYTRHVYIFPFTSTCPWGGLGTIGGSPYTKVWLNGSIATWTITHELGHNFGLWHSNKLNCDGGPIQGNCVVKEYGDEADNMGGGGDAHWNAFQKERIGWLNYLDSPPIKTVSFNGVYTIAPYEYVYGQVPKALKILKQILPDGSKDYYYLELRQVWGLDSKLNCPQCNYVKGVMIHTGNDTKGNSSYLLDMSPFDANYESVTLLPGQVFKDLMAANGGVTITVNSIATGTAGAKVTIQFGSA